MGALTHGDRHSAAKQQDLSKFNFDTPLGKKALDTVLKSIRKWQYLKIYVDVFFLTFSTAEDLVKKHFYKLE